MWKGLSPSGEGYQLWSVPYGKGLEQRPVLSRGGVSNVACFLMGRGSNNGLSPCGEGYQKWLVLFRGGAQTMACSLSGRGIERGLSFLEGLKTR